MPLILRQIWSLLRLCLGGPGRMRGLLHLAAAVAISLFAIYLNVRLIAWNADFFDALQKLDVSAAVYQIGVYAVLIAIYSAANLIGTYIRELLQIHWRGVLTETVIERWTATKAYWHLHPTLGGAGIDNPDQRIAEDCKLFVDRMLTTVLSFFISLVGLVSYFTVLWNLSSFPLSFTVFGYEIEIARYMVWAAPIYVFLSSAITHWLGKPLHNLSFEQERREANFRFSLVRLRELAASIALSGGEEAERRHLRARFDDIADNWRKLILRELILGCFTRPYSATIFRIPLFLALPAYLAGKVTLGGLMSMTSAFQNVATTLSWFIFNYSRLAHLAAGVTRLDNLLAAIAAVQDRHADSRPLASPDGAVRSEGLVLRKPDGEALAAVPDFRLEPGRPVWIRGQSGAGKTTLLKALAGLWAHADGWVRMPDGKTLFLPQQTYVPAGDVSAAAAYPRSPEDILPGDLSELLAAVGLEGRESDDARNLSPGEQQRLALLRVLLAKPDWAFLDEATSALDPQSEAELFALLRRRLPETTFVIVAHREPPGFETLHRVDLGANAGARACDLHRS